MKRELKGRPRSWPPSATMGNSSIPYEEGTERTRGSVQLASSSFGVTAAFPMKRELKGSCPGRGLWPGNL